MLEKAIKPLKTIVLKLIKDADEEHKRMLERLLEELEGLEYIVRDR